MMKKVTLLLVFSMLASCISCSSGASVSDDTTTAPTETSNVSADTEPLDALDARKLVDDELPEKDFEGAVFTILGETSKKEYLDVESTNGDVVNDAIFMRNQAVEERFNVELDYFLVDYFFDVNTQVAKNVNAGDDAFQLVSGHVVSLGQLVADNYLMNWYDIEHVNFNKPWWAKANIENLTYNDVCILAIGDYALTSISHTYCVYFNKRLTDEYQIADPYQTVIDGDWTIDYMISLTKDVYKDINNNGVEDEADSYGFIVPNANAFLWAFDNPIIENDPSKGLTVVYKSEKIFDIITKLVTMLDDNAGITQMGYNNNGTFTYRVEIPQLLFKDGQTIFTTASIGDALRYYRDMDDAYGILPYPKWNTEQEEYYTMVDGSHSAMAVPVTVTDTEMVGVITEALCAESYKQVVPQYYDIALKVKGTRDDTSVEIIDMLVENRVFDMGYVYDGFHGASFIIQKMTRESNTNFESHWASVESSVMEHYGKVIDFFENYGE